MRYKDAIYGLIIIICLVVITTVLLIYLRKSEIKTVASFDECISAGYPVLETYPRQCRTPDGKNFVEDIGNELGKSDLIKVRTPRPNQPIHSPVIIEGEARGYWFFEGDFPIRLLDENGTEIATGLAQARDKWMTDDFVPFIARVEFESLTQGRGLLILEKDNPSGLSEHADELRIPVRLEITNK